MPRNPLRTTLAALLIAAVPIVLETPRPAGAQAAASPQPSATPDSARQALAQRPLSDEQVQSFIAAAKPIKATIDKLPEAKRDEPDAQTEAAIDKIAAKFGFKDYGDFNEVGANIGFILQGFDPEKKAFVGHEAVIKNEIAEVNADKTLKPKDKADALAELEESLTQIDSVKYPENIKVVAKHYAELSDIFSN